jgi:hypothetical protein
MILETFLTVNWASFCWLEWNFSILATVRALYLVHLSRSPVKLRSTFITHISPSFTFVILRKLIFQYFSNTTNMNLAALLNICISIS